MAEKQVSYTVVITPEARDGLRQIVEYLEEEVSFEVAEYVKNAILAGIDTLIDRPESHGFMTPLNDGEITYRRVLVLKGKYVVVYTIIATKTEVRVVDISRSGRGPEYMEKIKGRR